MYVLTAEIALGASTETSRAMGIHLVNLPWPHLGPWMVSNVRCSSDVAFSRIWHVSSTKLIAELKPLIFTLFRKPWWCWGMCLSSESVRINSWAIRTAITWRWKGKCYSIKWTQVEQWKWKWPYIKLCRMKWKWMNKQFLLTECTHFAGQICTTAPDQLCSNQRKPNVPTGHSLRKIHQFNITCQDLLTAALHQLSGNSIHKQSSRVNLCDTEMENLKSFQI